MLFAIRTNGGHVEREVINFTVRFTFASRLVHCGGFGKLITLKIGPGNGFERQDLNSAGIRRRRRRN